MLNGLTPNAKMGFHIHNGSDLSDGCTKAGGHYNPYGKQHGCPGISGSELHYGDLGNIESSATGQCSTTFKISGSIKAPNSIVNRAIVIHENVDDCGLGGQNDSLINGHAGKRIACCLITIESCSGSGGIHIDLGPVHVGINV
ncbi:hypothetical protein B4U80_11537 [Leptotrombidium deliense]|uniref:Superoxide dismutase [Cu-Zn] n=1 Tax=Leptotrombidium deliense TaxID=299467 RepID=A0A443S529_9ACAR|nr:hypothetical protein B4U80_11537 [Leptotrombidium deliense]